MVQGQAREYRSPSRVLEEEGGGDADVRFSPSCTNVDVVGVRDGLMEEAARAPTWRGEVRREGGPGDADRSASGPCVAVRVLTEIWFQA